MHPKARWITAIALGVVLCIGGYLRFESVANTVVIYPIRADAQDYFMYAFNLKHKGVYSRNTGSLQDISAPVAPDAVRTPGYPLFISPFVDGPPTQHIVGKIVMAQAAVSTFTLFVAFFLSLKFLSLPWALAASLLTALSPHLVVANSYVLTESLFCFSIVSFAWLASLLGERPSRKLAFISGVALGVTNLVRPTVQYFPVLVAALLILSYGRMRGRRLFGIVVLGFILTLSPWLIRNLAVLGKISDSTLMINAIHHGLYPNFTYEGKPESYGFPYRFDPKSEEIGKSVATALGEVARRFHEEPVRHLRWFVLEKPIAYWSWNIVQGLGDVFVYPISSTPYFDSKVFQWTRALMYCLHWPLVIFCMASSSIVWIYPQWVPKEKIFAARLVSALVLYFTLFHIVAAPFPRYAVPLRPLMYGMALFLPYTLLSRSREKSSHH